MKGNLCKNGIFKSQLQVLISLGIPASRDVGVLSVFDSFTCLLFEKYFLASLTVGHPNNLQNQRFSSTLLPFLWHLVFPEDV